MSFGRRAFPKANQWVRVHFAALLQMYFIFVAESTLASFVYLSKYVVSNVFFVFFPVYMLQICFAPIQAGISDKWCRKTSLIIAFVAVLIGKSFFLVSYLSVSFFIYFTVVIYGLLGNITPIARAALVDTHLGQNIRVSMGLTTVAIALGWISMMYAVAYLHPLLVFAIVMILCAVSAFASQKLVEDSEDRPFKWEYLSPRGELKVAWLFLRNRRFIAGYVGYFFAELAFYLIFCHNEGDLSDPNVRFIVSTWVSGYCLGVLSQLLIKFSSKKGMILGTLITLACSVYILVMRYYPAWDSIIRIVVNMAFAYGYGIFVPCLFALLSEKQSPHRQGMIYGLVDSSDTLGLAFGIAIIYLMREISVDWIFVASTACLFIVVLLFRIMAKSTVRALD